MLMQRATRGGRAGAAAAARALAPAAAAAAPPLRRCCRRQRSLRAPRAPRASSGRQEEGGDDDGLDAPWAAPGYRGAVVSALPDDQQRLVVAGVAAALAAGTALHALVIGPAASPHLPGFLQVSRGGGAVLGLIFSAAGVAHFTEQRGFINMMPHQGAWGGLWRVPGSRRFHVEWTGVAEVAGGAGLVLGALAPLLGGVVPDWLTPASAWGLFLLTVGVTPANTYMYTHNAPGPIPDSMVNAEPIPPQGHLARGLMQMVLLSTLAGIANAPPA